MPRCPNCLSETADASRFCSTCGESLASYSQTLTRESGAGARPVAQLTPPAPPARHPTWSDAVVPGGFSPGTVIADRYRIVGLVGRGGMGEVYRADDLKLGQAVALKFLPRELSHDRVRLDRFFAEVRLSRQISHPNVCRMYDIGEVEGRHFLSMEYVDGEDLASLLRRIGHLPAEKALVIARQLCAGLAAAHDYEVLHRDLKPSNVMIDGRGRARITDFGLAVGAGQSAADGLGTPAYMAPEQLIGEPASVRTDIYSLGLLLYELWTGRPAYDGRSVIDLIEKKRVLPPAASEISGNIDPVVDRVILRCIDPDPRARPTSALQVARALPGADPLAAAVAAGETPSPEMVAASVEKGVLRRSVAVLLLAVALALLAVNAVAPAPQNLLTRVRLERGPEFLAGVATDISSRWCAPEQATFAAGGFEANRDYLRFIAARAERPDAWSTLGDARPGPVTFWYRSSTAPLVTANTLGRVTRDDPPFDQPGMCRVRLDQRGHLIAFSSVPPLPASPAPAGPDWKSFFTAAGLDIDTFHSAQPVLAPPRFADARFAWEPNTRHGAWPPRVEAASLGGRPIWFELTFPWSSAPPAVASRSVGAGPAYMLVVLVAWVGGIVLARRNWRLKQGDRRGAFRVAACVIVASLIDWLLEANHVANLGDEWEMATRGIGSALFWGMTIWLVYLGLEPSVRRRFPNVLVSWSRLLRGDVTDPLVGRDLLLGVIVAAALHLILRAEYLLPLLLGRPPAIPTLVGGTTLLQGSRGLVDSVAWTFTRAIVESLGTLVAFLISRLVIRNRWLADALFTVLLSFAIMFWTNPIWLYWPLAACRALVWILLLTRVGLLPFAAGLFTWYWIMQPVQIDTANFYASVSVAALIVVAALAVYGFLISTGVTVRRQPNAIAAFQ